MCSTELQKRYETCATLIFSKVKKKEIKREFGGHLGNGVITEKALVTGFKFWSKLFTRGVPHPKTFFPFKSYFKSSVGPLTHQKWKISKIKCSPVLPCHNEPNYQKLCFYHQNCGV